MSSGSTFSWTRPPTIWRD
ncbi:hypothetical protein LINPERHAP2_LOCUS21820 [Linum perenne]